MFFTLVPEGVRHLSIHRHAEQRNTSLQSLVCNTAIQRGTDRRRKKERRHTACDLQKGLSAA